MSESTVTMPASEAALDVRFVAGAVATVWCVTISIARPFFIVTDSGEDLGVVTADAIRKAQWRAGVA